MILKSFSLIKVKPGIEKDLVKKILKIPEALEVHSIIGEHDFIVILGVEEVLTSDPWGKLTTILTDNLRTIAGILETQTVIPTSSKMKDEHLVVSSKLARGFIYIDTKPGREATVMYKLFQMKEINEVHLLPGKHDILGIVEVEKTILPPRYPDLIQKVVVDKISELNDVQNTETIIPDSFNYKYSTS